MMGELWVVLLLALTGSHLGHGLPLGASQAYPHESLGTSEAADTLWGDSSGAYAVVPALAFLLTAVGFLLGCTWCYRHKDCKLFAAPAPHLRDVACRVPAPEPAAVFAEPTNNNVAEDNNNGPISLREMQNIANNNATAYITSENEERNRVASRESVVEFEPLPVALGVQDPMERCADWFDAEELPRDRLQYLREIGRGWFGRIVEGELEEAEGSPASPVAVKILKQDATPVERARFLDESRIYRQEARDGVLRCVARSLRTEPWILVFELCSMDLQQYLQENRPKMASLNEGGVPLRLQCDVAVALAYLHSQGIIYGDLWSGTVLVRGSAENARCVLGRYNDTPPPHCIDPPELRHRNLHTANSEIWSLGILLWEVCSWGASPSQVPTSEPALPCPYRAHLYQVMQLCWQSNPLARPTASQVHSLLQHLHTAHQRSNDLTHDDGYGSSDFEERWQRLKPNSIPKVDEHVAIVHAPSTSTASHFTGSEHELDISTTVQDTLSVDMDTAVSRSSSILSDKETLSVPPKSESMTNLHGSLDDVRNIFLTHNEHPLLECHQANLVFDDAKEKEQDCSDSSMDPWVKDIIAGSQDDVSYFKDVSDVIKNLDNILNSEKTSSSESSHQASPSRDNLSLDCKKEYTMQSSLVKSPGISNFQNVLEAGFDVDTDEPTNEDEGDRETVGTLSHSFERHSDTTSQHTLANLTPDTPIKDICDIESQIEAAPEAVCIGAIHDVVENISEMPQRPITAVTSIISNEIPKLEELCIECMPRLSEGKEQCNPIEDLKASCDSLIKSERTDTHDIVPTKSDNSEMEIRVIDNKVESATPAVPDTIVKKEEPECLKVDKGFKNETTFVETSLLKEESSLRTDETNVTSTKPTILTDVTKEESESFQTPPVDHIIPVGIAIESRVGMEQSAIYGTEIANKSTPLVSAEIVKLETLPSQIVIENTSEKCSNDIENRLHQKDVADMPVKIDTKLAIHEAFIKEEAMKDVFHTSSSEQMLSKEGDHQINKDPKQVIKIDANETEEILVKVTKHDIANAKKLPVETIDACGIILQQMTVTEAANESASEKEVKLLSEDGEYGDIVINTDVVFECPMPGESDDVKQYTSKYEHHLEGQVTVEAINENMQAPPKSLSDTEPTSDIIEVSDLPEEIKEKSCSDSLETHSLDTESTLPMEKPDDIVQNNETETAAPKSLNEVRSIIENENSVLKNLNETTLPVTSALKRWNEVHMNIEKEQSMDKDSNEPAIGAGIDESTVYMDLFNNTNSSTITYKNNSNIEDFIKSCMEESTSDSRKQCTVNNESTVYMDLPNVINETHNFLVCERNHKLDLTENQFVDVSTSTPKGSEADVTKDITVLGSSTKFEDVSEQKTQEDTTAVPKEKYVADVLSPLDSPTKSHPTDTYDENSSLVLGPFENCAIELYKEIKSSFAEIDVQKEELLAFSSNFSDINLETPSPLRDQNFLIEVPDIEINDNLNFDDLNAISEPNSSEKTETTEPIARDKTDRGTCKSNKSRESPATPPNSPGNFLASTSQLKYLVDIDLNQPMDLSSLQKEIELNQIELQITSKLAMAENENNLNIEYSGPLTVECLVTDESVSLRDSDAIPESYLAGNGVALVEEPLESFTLDECMAALRNELELKLPLAQVASIEPSEELPAWTAPELVVNYPGALSPIMEETGHQLSAYENDRIWNTSNRTDSSESYLEPCNNSTDEVTDLPTTGQQSGNLNSTFTVVTEGQPSADNNTYTIQKDHTTSRDLTMSADSLNGIPAKKVAPDDTKSPVNDRTYNKEEEKVSCDRISQVSPFLLSPTTDTSAPENSDVTGISTLSKTTVPTDAKASKPSENQCLSKATSIDSWCSNDTLFNVEDNFDDLVMDADVPLEFLEENEEHSESSHTLTHDEDEKDHSHCSTYIVHDSKSDACETFSPDSITAHCTYTKMKSETADKESPAFLTKSDVNDSTTKNTQKKDMACKTFVSSVPFYSNCTTELLSGTDNLWKVPQPELVRRSPVGDDFIPGTPPKMSEWKENVEASPQIQQDWCLNKMDSVEISCLNDNITHEHNDTAMPDMLPPSTLVTNDSPSFHMRNMACSIQSTPLLETSHHDSTDVIPMQLPSSTNANLDFTLPNSLPNFQNFFLSAELRPQDMPSQDTASLLEGVTDTLNKSSITRDDRTPTYSDFEDSVTCRAQDVPSKLPRGANTTEEFQVFENSIRNRPQDLSAVDNTNSLPLKSDCKSSEYPGSLIDADMDRTSQNMNEQTKSFAGSSALNTHLVEPYGFPNSDLTSPLIPQIIQTCADEDDTEQPHSIIVADTGPNNVSTGFENSTYDSHAETALRLNHTYDSHKENNEEDSSESYEKQSKRDTSVSHPKQKDGGTSSSHEKQNESDASDLHEKQNLSNATNSHEKHNESNASDSYKKHNESNACDSHEKDNESNATDSLEKHNESNASDSYKKHNESNAIDSHEKDNESNATDSHEKHNESNASDSYKKHSESNASDSHEKDNESNAIDSHEKHNERYASDSHEKDNESNATDSHEKHNESNASDSYKKHNESNASDSHEKQNETNASDSHDKENLSNDIDSHEKHNQSNVSDLHETLNESYTNGSQEKQTEGNAADLHDERNENYTSQVRQNEVTGDPKVNEVASPTIHDLADAASKMTPTSPVEFRITVIESVLESAPNGHLEDKSENGSGDASILLHNGNEANYATVNFINEAFEELSESNVDAPDKSKMDNQQNCQKLDGLTVIQNLDAGREGVKESSTKHEGLNGEYSRIIENGGSGDDEKRLAVVTHDFLQNEKKLYQIDPYFPLLSDIRFTGPTAEIMSTSFSQESPTEPEAPTDAPTPNGAADILKEWESDSDESQDSDPSSGEFIWKQRGGGGGGHAQSEGGGDVGGAARDHSSASGESGSGSEGDEVEFVPSSWDCRAAPAKSSLRSLEQAHPLTAESKKRVVFKRQKYHCVYEYPREVAAECDASPARLPDYSTYADWAAAAAEEAEISYGQIYGGHPFDMSYPLRTGVSFGSDYDEDFFISSSAHPFESLGIMSTTSQFFPGMHTGLKGGPLLDRRDSLTDEPSEEFPPPPSPLPPQTRTPSLDFTTPDSGVEDITPGSTTAEDFETKKVPESDVVQTQCWKSVDSASSSESVSPSSPGGEALGGLRHTRDKLKLDLPPSPHIPSPRHSRVFNFVLDKPKPKQREEKPPDTPLVMTDDTPLVASALPLHKQCDVPLPEPTFSTFGKHTRCADSEQKAIILDEVQEPIEKIDSKESSEKEDSTKEGTVLDSGDEDSGIESSSKASLERNKQTPNVS